MRIRPAGLDDGQVAAAVHTGWGLDVEALRHDPVGFGSHHWRVRADGRHWFATVDHVGRTEGGDRRDRLLAALGASRSLRDGGLAFVVAPIPSRAGDVAVALADCWVLAMYPEVVGRTHGWGPFPDAATRDAVRDCLVALHTTPATAAAGAGMDDLAIDARAALDAALEDLATRWDTGPHGKAARQVLVHHADAVHAALADHDAVAARLVDDREGWVVTHGEPHAGNVIVTVDGVVLVDWDTVLRAPAARDLWWLAREDPGVVADWQARTGLAVDPAALGLYRRRWDLTDTALYVADFRRPHGDTADTAIARDALAGALARLGGV